MNRKELSGKVATKLGFQKTDIDEILLSTFEVIKEIVASGEEVSIVRFGVIKPAHKKARISRNPRTGEIVKVKAKNLPVFKPSGLFKQAVANAKVKKK